MATAMVVAAARNSLQIEKRRSTEFLRRRLRHSRQGKGKAHPLAIGSHQVADKSWESLCKTWWEIFASMCMFAWRSTWFSRANLGPTSSSLSAAAQDGRGACQEGRDPKLASADLPAPNLYTWANGHQKEISQIAVVQAIQWHLKIFEKWNPSETLRLPV